MTVIYGYFYVRMSLTSQSEAVASINEGRTYK